MGKHTSGSRGHKSSGSSKHTTGSRTHHSPSTHHHFSSPSHHHHHYSSSPSTHHHSYSYSDSSYYGYGHHHRTGKWFIGPAIYCICVLVFIIIVASLTPHNSSKNLDIAPYEQYLIRTNNEWYTRMDISLPPQSVGTVETYLLSSTPQLQTDPVQKNEQHTLRFNGNTYHSLAYHLTAQSSLFLSFTVSSPPGTNIDFWLIKGQSNFDDFQNGNSFSFIKYYNSPSTQFTEKISSTDDYFLVWENSIFGISVTVNAVLTIDLYQYDVSNYLETCSDTVCSFDLDQAGAHTVLFQANDNGSLDAYSASYELVAKDGLYWSIFAPFFIVCICCCIAVPLVVFFFFKKTSQSADYKPLTSPAPPSSYNTEAGPPISSQAPSPYTAPPSYSPAPLSPSAPQPDYGVPPMNPIAQPPVNPTYQPNQYQPSWN